MSATWIWLIVGATALGIEIFVTDLTFALIGLGAFVGALAVFLGAPLWLSVVLAVVVALAGIAWLRPIALRHLKGVPFGARTGVDALLGVEGLALTDVTESFGRMKLRGEEWSARLDPDITCITAPRGSRLVVTRIDGATALVHPID